MFERAEAVGSFVRWSFKQRKSEISSAHNFGHVQRVAEYAPQIVLALGGSKKEAELAKTAAFLHDFYRSPREDIEDEIYSAEKAGPVLEKFEGFSGMTFSPTERRTIIRAMQTHTVAKELLSSDSKHERAFQGEDLIRFAVFAADKLEANGPYVMARRSQFVGGERHSEGDISEIRERLVAAGNPLAKKLTPAMAVLLESYIRLGKKNNPRLYPNWFRPVVDGLFEHQKDFYYSLLKAHGLHEEDIAALLKQLKFPGIKPEEIEEWEEKRPDSNKAVDGKTNADAKAALEVVRHFSSKSMMRLDTAGAIKRFQPKSRAAKRWHSGMLSYLKGGVKPLIESLKAEK